MNSHSYVRRSLLVSTALIGALALPGQLHAQEAGAEAEGGLEEIVVTAQKREQSLQDVPIAVTAVTQEALQANRIFSVNDLSAIAPGVTVKPSPGGSSVPVFTIRGQSSFGVVPGSDKQVSIYIDGVYISSPRGSIFELPDIQRLEVLRGPQGTLFGRNATAGAISITTRDPTGDAHIKASGTVGNRDAYRFQVTADLPQMGPFSAFGSFVRNYRRGEVRNAAGGLIWDRSASRYGVQRSAEYLGTVNSNSYFGAVKFEPTDTFKLVYKYDRNEDEGTPDVTGFIGYDPTFRDFPAASRPLIAPILSALYTSQNLYAAPDGKRPSVATNGFAVPRTQTVQGHSATATWQATDSLTFKNIFAYRKSEVLGPTPIDGISSLTFTQAALDPFVQLSVASIPGFFTLPAAQQAAITTAARNVLSGNVGQRFILIAAQSASVSKQWSDELQVNFSSGNLNATVGALWFHSKDVAGGPEGYQNTLSFPTFVPQSGVLPLGNEGRYNNEATSIAAYGQLEYKITPQFEVVLGARITRDKKSSTFTYNTRNAATGVVSPNTVLTPPDFKKTKPNFLVGLNWTPNDDILVYGKFSNSFVSGGSTGGIPYEPETAKSFELGVKADLLDRKLRTNLALFHVDYNHFQQSQSTSATASAALALPILTQLYGATIANEMLPKLSVFVGDQGKVRAKGFELEVTAAPTTGVTLGGSLSYTDISYPFVEPAVLAANGGRLDVAARPEWTGSIYGSYETQPLFGDTRLSLRADAFYQGSMTMAANPDIQIFDFNRNSQKVDGYWTINARMALKHIPLGPIDAELAVWGKNLTDRKDITTTLYTPFATSASYVPARTYGLDLTVEF
jgi:iron complex outermembrane recepter protein